MSYTNDGLSGNGSDFIILAEVMGVIEPIEGMLNHPKREKLLPLMRFIYRLNVHIKTKDLIHIQDNSIVIDCNGEELLNRLITFKSKFYMLITRLRVMNTRCMDDNCKQVFHHVYNNAPLPTFRFFLR